MNERRVISIVAFCMAWHHSASLFFHEKSAMILQPSSPDELKSSDFGFSLAYHQQRLVVGDPRSSEKDFGAIYNCTVDVRAPNTCSKVKLDITTKNITHDLNPTQNFYLGGTIAAGENYFFTCAPLVTQSLTSLNGTDAVGACFVYYDNGTTCQHPSQTFLENESAAQIIGGIGWNSLADKNNELLLVAKTSLQCNIMYGNLTNPEGKFKFAFMANDPEKGTNFGYGLAAGTFFSEKTVYAVSKQFLDMSGQIIFFEWTRHTLRPYYNKRGRTPYRISSQKLSTMFGYALGAADLNADEFSELLVGAPAESDDDDKVESGALHIYSSLQSHIKKFFIFADEERGRFGTAIATSDMDGDGIPEVFVSAPYEGSGAVYVLSGRELKDRVMTAASSKAFMLSALKRTQRITHKRLELFGFSLLVIPDVDKNGHSDMAIGAPGSSSVLLLRSYQTIEVNITSEIVGSTFIKVEQSTFDVQVCINISNSVSPLASGRLIVKNVINTPRAFIEKPDFEIVLPDTNNICQKIHVTFHFPGPGAYKFETNVTMDTKFDNWVVISPNSVTKKVLDVRRRCIEGDCKTKLALDNIQSSFGSEGNYALGSSDKASVTVVVKNAMNENYAFGASVKFEVSGATITEMSCRDARPLHCALPKFRNTFEINMELNMKGRKNTEKEFNLVAKLYEDYDESTPTDIKTLNITYSLTEQQKLLFLETTPREDLNVTERDLANGHTEFILTTHNYRIINNGTIFWDMPVSITVENYNLFIEKVTTTVVDNCNETNLPTKLGCHYNVNVKPGESKLIAVSIFISKNKLSKHANNLLIKSEVTLQPTATDSRKTKHETNIRMIAEHFQNSKYKMIIIGVVLALFVITLIGFILWKKGFFKRKERQRFDEMRESIRKRSIRLASETRRSVKESLTGSNGLPNVQEEDDAVFIIEEQQPGHSERAVD